MCRKVSSETKLCLGRGGWVLASCSTWKTFTFSDAATSDFGPAIHTHTCSTVRQFSCFCAMIQFPTWPNGQRASWPRTPPDASSLMRNVGKFAGVAMVAKELSPHDVLALLRLAHCNSPFPSHPLPIEMLAAKRSSVPEGMMITLHRNRTSAITRPYW